ncbi:MAG: DUF86 domain-containing protein [Thermodesulfovibrionales bacterium]|nr:DUF86 domain-containing protein [Thermodesulfovibrionales bacterium]
MSSAKVIENKASAVRKYLKILQRYRNLEKGKIQNDIDIRGAVERYLYLAIQSTIDLAEAVIAYKDFRKPTTMSEAFYILDEEKFIPQKLTNKLSKMVGFRNILAHDYEDIDYDIVCNALREGTKDIEDFLCELSGKLNLRL